jgi:GNAT superfamily N-acetyltransferase
MTQQPALRIAAATPADVPLILRLIRELADYEQLSHEVLATEDDLSRWLFGVTPAAAVLLAHVGEHAAGYALYFQTFSTFVGRPGIYLEDLFVRPPFRRQGIGRALLAALAAEAVRRECGRLEWSVLDWNASAIAFYEQLGAKPMNEWTVYRLAGDSLVKLSRQETV